LRVDGVGVVLRTGLKPACLQAATSSSW
jgi:hypothetical protein